MNIRMGVALCAAAALMVGCAGHPAQPGTAATPPKTPVTRQVPVDASNVAEVQRAGYKLVNKDGQKLYCRTDPITGSRLEKVTTCLTEQELFDQMRQMQQAMSQITSQQVGPAGK